MSIQEHLNKIRNAIKGSEVRESIAKGIETAYDDASENGNANMEVKIARGTHPNLRSRLEEVDNKQQQTTAQLAQTESDLKNKITSGDNSLKTQLNNLVLENSGDSNAEVIQARGVHQVLNGRLDTIEKGLNEPKTENPFKTIGIKTKVINENILTFIENHKLIIETNAIEEEVGFHTSELVKVSEGDYVFLRSQNYRYRLVQYDQQMNIVFDSGMRDLVSTQEREIVESGYLRLMIENNISNINERTDNFRFVAEKKESVYYDNAYYNEAITKDAFYFQVGALISSDGAVYYHQKNRALSNYVFLQDVDIKIESLNEDVMFRVAFYDDNSIYKEQISWNHEEFTQRHEGRGYARITLSYRDSRDLTEADIHQLKASLNVSITPLKTETESTIIQGETTEGYYFRSKKLPPLPVGIEAWGYEQFIENTWELLRDENPDYIKRHTVIKDTSENFNIYEYVFTPRSYNKTVFLTAGVHGDEYEGFWGLFHFMKNIVEESYKHKKLRDARHDVRFVIIPVLNPYGLENRQRATSRLNDVNKNYDVFFGAPEYVSEGDYAFSENESRAVKIVADKYSADFDLYLDFHTDHYDPKNSNYILTNRLSSVYDLSEKLMLDEFKFLEDEFGFITTRNSTPNTNWSSSSFKYMEAVRGVPSAILEAGIGHWAPIGSSESIATAVSWYTNIVTEFLKHDLKKPEQAELSLEQAVQEGRLEGYTHSVVERVPDEHLQAFIKNKGDSLVNKAMRANVIFDSSSVNIQLDNVYEFVFAFKGTINSEGALLHSENGDFKLSIQTVSGEPDLYKINSSIHGDLESSALKYGEVVQIVLRSSSGRLSLYVNGEFFSTTDFIRYSASNLFFGNNASSTYPLDVDTEKLLLYNNELTQHDFGFIFKNFVNS